jgi:hypothetical protein
MQTRRSPLLVALAATAALALPAVAQADDAAMKAGVLPGLIALAKKETAAYKALTSVDRRGRSAVPAARRKVRAASRSAKVFIVLLGAQQPSTPNGERAKALLLAGLNRESIAYARADRALRQYAAGHTAQARRTLNSAHKQLVAAVNDGKKGIEILATL